MSEQEKDRKTKLRERLDAARQQLLDAVADLGEADWQTPVQADGDQWTVLQMLRHLQDAEIGLTGQAMRIVAGEESIPRDFDVNRWNARVQRKTAEAEMTPEQALSNLQQSRQALLEFLDSIQEEDWRKSGWQAGLGQELSLYKFIAVIAAHEAQHAGEIAAAVKK